MSERLEPSPGLRVVRVRDLVLPCRIGASEAERRAPQPVRVDVRLLIREEPAVDDADLASVVDYTGVAERLRLVVAGAPVHLVETLAERVAAACFYDARITRVRVRIEKPEALVGATVGVEIERRNPAA